MQKTASSGPVFGVGVGARLLFFTFGVRARDLILSDIGNLWEIGGEAAFHLRVWHIDPYFGVRGGYNFVGSLNQSSVNGATGNTSPSVSVHGFNVGPMIGIDYYFDHWISVGADFDAQFLFLQRPSRALPAGVTQARRSTRARRRPAALQRVRLERRHPGSRRRPTWAFTSEYTGPRARDLRWLLPATLPAVLFAVLVHRTRRAPRAGVARRPHVRPRVGRGARRARHRDARAAALTGLDVRVSAAGESGALVFLFFVVAPMQEAGKVAAAWPAFLSKHFDEPYDGRRSTCRGRSRRGLRVPWGSARTGRSQDRWRQQRAWHACTLRAPRLAGGAKRSTRRRVTDGASSASPVRTSWTAATRCSGVYVLEQETARPAVIDLDHLAKAGALAREGHETRGDGA